MNDFVLHIQHGPSGGQGGKESLGGRNEAKVRGVPAAMEDWLVLAGRGRRTVVGGRKGGSKDGVDKGWDEEGVGAARLTPDEASWRQRAMILQAEKQTQKLY